jgi:hypothetical protein
VVGRWRRGVVQVLGDGHVNASGGQIDCGQGSKHCYFSSSTSASVTLTAAIGFASWNGSADCNGTTESCTFTLDPGDDDEEVANSTPTPPTTLTVAVTGDASNAGGKVTGGGLECDPGEIDCSLNVYTGSTLTMVAEPSDGYDSTGWGGACSGTDVFCTVQMSAAQTVNASFGPGSHTLRLVAADPYGRVRTLTWVVALAT